MSVPKVNVIVISNIWTPGSVFNRQSTLVVDDLPPSLRNVKSYTREDMHAKYSSTALMPVPIQSLPSIEAQQVYVKGLISKLCCRYAIQRRLPVNHDGMNMLYAKSCLFEEIEMRPNGTVVRSSRTIEQFYCVPVKSYDYIRVNITGKRAGRARSIDWLHRIVCWVAHGSPPGGNYSSFQAGHLCGNRWCICPMHLRWMTRTANDICKVWHKQFPEQERLYGMHLWHGPFDV
jgi:hypothetical protein